ncbi:HAMP domain-containing protein [Herbaspirillum sp. HC18]|nr:HAMP domain-containing protein [Herbaspirillum sp. HC18]
MGITAMKIGTRLGMSFGGVLALMMTLAGVSVWRYAALGGIGERMVNEDWPRTEAISVIDATTRDNAARTMQLFIAQDKEEAAAIYKRIEANKKTISDAIARLEKLSDSQEDSAAVMAIKEARGRYVASFSKVGKLLEAENRTEAARIMAGETLPLLEALEVQIKARWEHQEKDVEDGGREMKSAIRSDSLLLLGLGCFALVVGIVLSAVLTRSITGPMNRAVVMAQTVAGGDLTGSIEVHGNDECAKLLHALKHMNGSLTTIVGQVRAGAHAIAAASSQVKNGNLDLSARTEAQASALEETASSIEELTGAVQHNAENAQHANRLAKAASDVALRGGDVVTQVVGTMSSIKESSAKIVDIIAVIDGIAFQTNILALNAAVEAARAGEQGRGFAVVASEVRNLAQRSASAAREIKALIGDSVEKVKAGTTLVDQAGSTMSEIVDSIKRVTLIMDEIALASHEQTSGIEQIRQAIGQMDHVTQKNASQVEEAAVAADSLNTQANGLAELVGVFKMNGAASAQRMPSIEVPEMSGKVTYLREHDNKRRLMSNSRVPALNA